MSSDKNTQSTEYFLYLNVQASLAIERVRETSVGCLTELTVSCLSASK